MEWKNCLSKGGRQFPSILRRKLEWWPDQCRSSYRRCLVPNNSSSLCRQKRILSWYPNRILAWNTYSTGHLVPAPRNDRESSRFWGPVANTPCCKSPVPKPRLDFRRDLFHLTSLTIKMLPQLISSSLYEVAHRSQGSWVKKLIPKAKRDVPLGFCGRPFSTSPQELEGFFWSASQVCNFPCWFPYGREYCTWRLNDCGVLGSPL